MIKLSKSTQSVAICCAFFVLLFSATCQQSSVAPTAVSEAEPANSQVATALPEPTDESVEQVTVQTEPTADTPTELPPTAEPTLPPTEEPEAEVSSIRELMIIYTNDEHGWMEGMEAGQGAAEIVSLWREDGCEPETCLILSGGDMWTGPAISTWFEGASMADVLDEMGYAAAAVGNHEFDFGLDQLQYLAEQSAFPFVSANIRYKDTGEVPTDVGVEPFVIVERSGIQIGILGLSTRLTPQTTLPTNVAAFDFIDYKAALEDVIPQAQAAGAEMIVVPGHICSPEVALLVRSGLEIHMVGGGHCNELQSNFNERNGVVSLIGGNHLRSYALARVEFDVGAREIVSAETVTRQNSGGATDPVIAGIIAQWRAAADEELNEVIGYLDGSLERRSAEMQTLVTESWLVSLPSSDIAASNLGGFRQALPTGELTVGDVVGMLPFDNVLVEVKMTGAEFERVLGIRPDIAIGGVQRAGVRWILNKTGEPLDSETVYTVVVSDFMYAGGDQFDGLAKADPNAYNTAIDWKQPVIDWVRSVESSAENPLNAMIYQMEP